MSDPVLKRVSVRKFNHEAVSEADIEKLIKAFHASPAAMGKFENMQAVVVQKPKYLDEVENAIHGHGHNAPVLFVIATKKDDPMGERNASVAAQNVMIEAASLDLGSTYTISSMELNKNPEVMSHIGIDHGFEASVIIAIGHPEEELKAETDRSARYKVTRR